MTAVRRLRLRHASPAEAKIEQIRQKVLSIGEMQDEVERLQAEIKDSLTELDDAMKDARTKELECGVYRAEYVTPASRSTTTIEPEDLMAVLPEEEFLDCVTVGVTKCKKYLSGKQLESIATVTPGKTKDPVLHVGHIHRS